MLGVVSSDRKAALARINAAIAELSELRDLRIPWRTSPLVCPNCSPRLPGRPITKHGYAPGFPTPQTAETTRKVKVSMDAIPPSSTSRQPRPKCAIHAPVRGLLPPVAGSGAWTRSRS